MNLRNLYFSTKGKVSRRTYITYFFLPWACILLSFGFLINGSTGQHLSILFLLLTAWPYVAMLVKRFRDRYAKSWHAFLVYHLIGAILWVGFIFLLVSCSMAHASPNSPYDPYGIWRFVFGIYLLTCLIIMLCPTYLKTREV